MRNLVPLTKIILTLGTAVWAIVLQKPESLLLLCLFPIYAVQRAPKLGIMLAATWHVPYRIRAVVCIPSAGGGAIPKEHWKLFYHSERHVRLQLLCMGDS